MALNVPELNSIWIFKLKSIVSILLYSELGLALALLLLNQINDINTISAFKPSMSRPDINSTDYDELVKTNSQYDNHSKELNLILNILHSDIVVGDRQSLSASTFDAKTGSEVDNSIINISVRDENSNLIKTYTGNGNVSGIWTIKNLDGVVHVNANANSDGYKPTSISKTFVIVNQSRFIQNSSDCKKIQPTGADASSFETDPKDYHPPTDAVDGDLKSWWSTQLLPAWIKIQMGGEMSLCSVDLAWNKGDERQYDFVISGSLDGKSYDNFYSGKSLKTLNLEEHKMQNQKVTSIKILITGSTSKKGWASIKEVSILAR